MTKLGELNLDPILTAQDLVDAKRFNDVKSVYNTPDRVLPRVRRNGKIIRPLRFYKSDVDRLFSAPRAPERSLTIESNREPVTIARPSILFKKRRK